MLTEASSLDTKALDRNRLRIGDVTICLTSEDRDLRFHFGSATENFLVAESETPNIRLAAAWGKLKAEPLGQKLFDSGALWDLYRDNGSYVFRFISPAVGARPYKVAWLNPTFTSGRILLNRRFFRPYQPIDPLEYPLDELLITHFLARGVGIEVHACGVADEEGNGLLFAGPSGAGKTTTARLWEKQAGITVLSDDRIILRKVDGRVWMYGTPWHGDARLASPGRAPLTRLCFLRHGNQNELLPLPQIEAAAQLLTRSFLPFYSAEALSFALEFCEEVTKDTPCFDFSFVPDKSAVEFLRERRG